RYLTEVLRRTGHFEEAVEYARCEVDATRSDLRGARGALESEWQLAHVLRSAGREDEALASLQQATLLYRDNALAAASLLQMQVWALLQSPRADAAIEAEPIARQGLAVCGSAFSDSDWLAWMRHYTAALLGQALSAQGRFDEAEPLILDAFER